MAKSMKALDIVFLLAVLGSCSHWASGSAAAGMEVCGDSSAPPSQRAHELPRDHMLLAVSRGTSVKGSLTLEEGTRLLRLEAKLTAAAGVRAQSNQNSDRSVEGSEQERPLGRMLATVQKLAVGVVNGTEQLSDATAAALSSIGEEMQKIRNATSVTHAEDQDEVDRAQDGVAKCDDWALVTNASHAATREEAHAQCRSSEVELHQMKTTACDNYMVAMQGLDPPDCAANLPANPQPTDLPAILSCVRTTVAYWQDFNASATDLAASCDQGSIAHANKKRSCDSAQATYEAAFCSYHTQLTGACSMYDKCRASAALEQQEVQAKVKVAEASRKAQYVAAAHIECHLEVLTAVPEQQLALLEKCRSMQVSSSHLNITYHGVPEGAGCDVSPVATRPCQELWLQERYEGKSWYIVAPTVTCTPCEPLEPTPAPTPASVPSTSPFCAGSTPVGSTDWQHYTSGGIFVDVNTSVCGFIETPVYVTSMGGTINHWMSTGSSEIYFPTASGFLIYINLNGITTGLANERGYHINWIAHRSGGVTSVGSCSGNGSMWETYNSGITSAVDSSGCGFRTTPVYVTSLTGTGYHWVTRGSSEVYSPSATGFRNYILGSNTQTAESYGWEINWIAHDPAHNSEKACSGGTPPGATAWEPAGNGEITVHIDTSACGFEGKPVYVTSLAGSEDHWRSTGSSELCEEDATGFRIYIHLGGVTPDQANQYQWHVNWVAAEAEK